MENTDKLQAYIQKILNLQNEQRERPVDGEELKRIALELGLSDSEISFINSKQKDYFTRGEGYSRYEDWDSAIEEFQQSVILNPSHVEALYGLGNAYKHRYMLKKNKDDLQNAKNSVKQALQINASHEPSFKLSAELNKGNFSKTNPFSQPNDNQSKLNKMMQEVLDDMKGTSKSIFNNATTDIFKTNHDKRLRKSSRDKKIFGVCGGIAEYLGIDSTWVRLAFIIFLFTGGFSFPLYLALAFIMPKNN